MRTIGCIAVMCLLPAVAFGDALELIPNSGRKIRPQTMEQLEPVPENSPPNREKVDVSTVVGPETGEIDLRPPAIPLGEFGEDVEPSWIDGVIDDHLLIWREIPIGTELVPRVGTAFGMTTLGVKFDVVGKGPMWVTGSFGWNFLSGPNTAAVPPQTYDLGIEINYAKKIDDLWGVHLNLTPLWATDFSNNSSDAFRLMAGGLVTYQAAEKARLVAGLSYLDRPDLEFLPIAGVKWNVTENVEIDAIVPRPRVAWRFSKDEVNESWLFMAGEVGGGSWAIQREGNENDQMGYRDLRWLGGVEYKQISGSRSVFEAGYVFNRHIEFEHGPGNVNPGSTFLIRWGQFY